jgi:hypothetical protein
MWPLEIAHNSLVAPNPEGALIRVDPPAIARSSPTASSFPGGVALGKNDESYVTNCGVCFDDGEVLRINP